MSLPLGNLPDTRYPDPRIEALDKRFIYKQGNAAIERIATGFRWAEGPAWFGDHGCLIFSTALSVRQYPMATVLVRFDGGDVPIVTGDVPPSPDTPITSPQPTGFTTNQAFATAEGVYCFGLQTTQHYAPLWQTVQAVNGEQKVIAFRRQP